MFYVRQSCCSSSANRIFLILSPKIHRSKLFLPTRCARPARLLMACAPWHATRSHDSTPRVGFSVSQQLVPDLSPFLFWGGFPYPYSNLSTGGPGIPAFRVSFWERAVSARSWASFWSLVKLDAFRLLGTFRLFLGESTEVRIRSTMLRGSQHGFCGGSFLGHHLKAKILSGNPAANKSCWKSLFLTRSHRKKRTFCSLNVHMPDE